MKELKSTSDGKMPSVQKCVSETKPKRLRGVLSALVPSCSTLRSSARFRFLVQMLTTDRKSKQYSLKQQHRLPSNYIFPLFWKANLCANLVFKHFVIMMCNSQLTAFG